MIRLRPICGNNGNALATAGGPVRVALKRTQLETDVGGDFQCTVYTWRREENGSLRAAPPRSTVFSCPAGVLLETGPRGPRLVILYGSVDNENDPGNGRE